MRVNSGWAILLAAWMSLVWPGGAYCVEEEQWRKLILRSLQLTDAGQYATALSLAEAALEEARKFGEADVRVAYALAQTGNTNGYLGRFEEAEQQLRKGALLLEAHPAERLALCQLLINLGNLFASSGGRFAQAESARQRALDIARAELGPRHPLVGELMGNLAEVKIVRRKWKEARGLLEEAREFLDFSATSQREAASVHSALGLLALVEEQPRAAAAECERTIEILRGLFEPGHPDFLVPLLNLGRARLMLRQFAEAETAILGAQKIAETKLGLAHPNLAEVFVARASLLRATGKGREASRWERRSEEIRSQHPRVTTEMDGTVSAGELQARSGRVK